MAKKHFHEQEIRKGIDALSRSGVAVDVPAPSLVPRLKEEFGKEQPLDLAVVFLLGKIADQSAVEALAAMERQAKDKELKKEIRRSLFKLAQRGLAVAQAARVESPSRLLARAPEIEAYMSGVDGGGGRLLWIVKPQPPHGLQAIQAMVNDREGLQRVGGTQLRRKELRNMVDEIKARHGVTMIPVPWEYADRVLYEGYEKAKALGRTGLEQFHELRSLVNTGKPKAENHPVYRKLRAEEARAGAWRELSRRLLEEPELGYWVLTDEWIREFLPQIEAAQTSRLVLNPLQKEERMAAIVRDAVKALCGGENGALFKRRMEDMALYFAETGRPESAKLALAVALQAGEGDPGPLDVSFLTGLVQKSFAFLLSEQKEKTKEEASLIVKP